MFGTQKVLKRWVVNNMEQTQYLTLAEAAQAVSDGKEVQYENAAIWFDVKDHIPISQNPEITKRYRLKPRKFSKGWYEYKGVLGGLAYYTGDGWMSLEWYGMPDESKIGSKVR